MTASFPRIGFLFAGAIGLFSGCHAPKKLSVTSATIANPSGNDFFDFHNSDIRVSPIVEGPIEISLPSYLENVLSALSPRERKAVANRLIDMLEDPTRDILACIALCAILNKDPLACGVSVAKNETITLDKRLFISTLDQ